MEESIKSKIMIHPTADVQSKNIGENTTIWQFCVILPDAVVGKNCNINCNVFIENDVFIGNNVTVKTGVQIWNGVILEDNVFIGPNVTFTNDLYPRSKRKQFPLLRTLVKEGASIGGNATILAGRTIGRFAMVGAGAVITKDVLDFELWLGNPARKSGYVTQDGEVLDLDLKSKISGKKFCFENGILKERDIIIIKGEGIRMRLVEESDAGFILKLRTDERLKLFISWTSTQVEDQLNWIREYKNREDKKLEYYFLFEDVDNKPWGVIRLYGFSGNSFTIGSWVCFPGNSEHIAVKAWLLGVQFGFDFLNFDTCLIDVRKKNLYVLYYLKLFNPVLIKENKLDYFFQLNKDVFFKNRDKILKILNIKL